MEDDDSKSQPVKAGRKRSRPESVTSKVSPATENKRKSDNVEDPPVQNLAPHTLRLLKLVEEGTVEHAQLAAAQLSEITAGSSPLVLWDILGRLQGYLTSPHWKTRQNASVAMEGVARQLPISDQREFLEHTAAFHRDNETTSNSTDKHTWLTLVDLNENIETVLKNGRTLLSSSETKYDQLEEDALEHLDAASKGDADFVSRRIQLQRQILARRLGLSAVLSHVSGKNVDTVLSEEDLLPWASQRPLLKSSSKNKTKGRRDKKGDTSKSIRGLLVFEIQQQQQQQSHTHGVSHRAIQHQTAQRLLATELVFRMFDASWHIRHGSLMGILALMRAWKVHETAQFGIWPHDIMSRCLCVLALDRFADYSETSTSSESGGIVAPVREMTGQVFAVLYRTAPESFQRSGYEILSTLVKQREDESEDWEIRYAALLALKYIFALQAKLPSRAVPQPVEWSELCFERTLEAATTGLDDASNDVRGVAAEVLVMFLSNDEMAVTFKHSPFLAKTVRCLWDALSPGILISSSIKDLVGLLSTLICMDFSQFVNNIPLDQTKENPCNLLLVRLQMLTTCPYISVKTTVVILIGTVSKRLENYVSKVLVKADDHSRSCIAASFCSVIQTVYGLCFERTDAPDVSNQDIHAFVTACEETWLLLARASRSILGGVKEKRLELERSMILDYFCLLPGTPCTNVDISSLSEASFGQNHRFRIDVADALSILLSESDLMENNTSLEVLELCLRICLDSLFVSHCERACLLFTSLCRFQKNLPIFAVLERCKDSLLKVILEAPQCLTVDRQSLHDSRTSLLNFLNVTFESRIESLTQRHGTVEAAISAVSMLWKTSARRHQIEQTDVAVDLNSMRLYAATAGALVAGGGTFVPTKLTPIVRSLMTSVQNELDQDCQATTCDHMVALLAVLSGPTLAERQEAFQKTRSKVLQNLCKLIKSNVDPGSVVASRVIADTVSKAASPLQSYPAIWEAISPLIEPRHVMEATIVEGLLLLDAVCLRLDSNSHTTSLVIAKFLSPVASLCCTSSNAIACGHAVRCVEMMTDANQTLALETVLPTIALMCAAEDDSCRERACNLMLATISGTTMPLCPFVRSMLPLAMQLMTDSSEKCAKIAARIFSRLVQIAPLVKDSVALRLLQDSWDDKADRVMDHLIHGKPLPPCEINPAVNDALRASGVTLRPYQLEGVAWLRFLQTVKLNGALTDSMGLGKTLQSLVGIALAHGDSKNGETSKSIVICPSSVLGHWMKEVARFFPGTDVFRPFCLRGSNHKKELPSDCNLIITSYSVLRSQISYLSATQWSYCVLDEGHLLKNPKTATAKAARKIQARHKLILTGTPVQNKVNEVWATFDFLMPNFLGSSPEFSKDFARPISKSQLPGASASDIALGMEKLKLLHQQVLPFILRREKENVLKELPPKIITTIPCDMSPRQHQLYQDFCSSSQGQRSIGAFNGALQEPSSDVVIPSLGSDILKALLYLRLVCTHPALVDSNGISVGDVRHLASSGKLIALKEILREAGMQCHDMGAADNDSSLIYIDADECDDSDNEDLQGVLDPDSNDSMKSLSVPSYPTPSGSKCLIFAQFTHSLDVIEEFLCQHFPGTKFLRLDGKVPTEKRGEIVDSFNGDDSVKILLLTTRIGGLGLNLTGADTVIFLEHDWNPHADLQAMDRAHRIGQKKTVNVYKLVTVDSIEEKIMKLHETKLAMSNAIVNAENSTLYSMGTDQLLDIFRFRSENSDSKAKATENNLDALVERYEDEYASLFVGNFIKTFKGHNELS